MNKVSKICIIVVCFTILVAGTVFAVSQIYEIINRKVNLTPALTMEMKDIDTNNIWVGSFQIAWNEFVDKIIGKDIIFEDGESILASELNKKSFTKDMISSNDYYIKIGKTSNELKKEILQDINKKFKISNSSILDKVDFNEDSNSESYTIYSVLYKNFEFLTPFDKLRTFSFNNSQETVEYFGITKGSLEDLYNNVDVLFYNNENDFAVKLNTKNNEDLILYCNNSSNSFNYLFNEVKEKTEAYTGKSEFTENDELAIPYMNLDIIVNYDELCNRVIQGTNELYIENAFQNVKFSLNEKGGNVISEAAIKDAEMSSGSEPPRIFFYDKPFVIFLKESDKDKPYFALKVDNTDVLVKTKI